MVRALPALLALLLVSPVLASPGQDTARRLADEEISPSAAAAAWADQGLTAEQAMDLVTKLAPKRGPQDDHTIKLTDGFGRESHAIVRMPSTTRDDGRYSVLIALHGLGGNSKQLLPFATRVVSKGTIVIAPGALRLSKEQEAEDTFGVGLTSQLPHWWSVKPHSFPLKALAYLKRHYPIDTDRVSVLGYSMGGYGTWNVGLRYPDRFAAIVPLAGGISRLENFTRRDPRSRKLLNNAVMVPSFFVHGSADRTVPPRFSKTIHEDLEKIGAEHRYTEVPGRGHYLSGFLRGNELTDELISWLGSKVRDPNPRRVEHTILGTYHGSSYWLRIDEAPKGGMIMAEASGNTITVHSEGVRKLTVFIDPDLVDVNAPVTVKVGGVVYHEGKVEPSLQAVAESYAADLDPQLTWSRQVVVDLAH
jgi:predicted esterase